MNIFVGNLSSEANESDLRAAFEPFGNVDSAVIIKDKISGQAKGFGFVEMPTKSEAEAAIEGLNGKPFKGKNLTVNEARPRTENRSGGGRSSFGGGYSGGGGNRSGFSGGGGAGKGGSNRGPGSGSRGGFGGGKPSQGGGRSSQGRGR